MQERREGSELRSIKQSAIRDAMKEDRQRKMPRGCRQVLRQPNLDDLDVYVDAEPELD